MEDSFEKRKQKIVNWLKNPYNLTFLGILILGIIIRLYYFSLTKNQPLWWDEADYMAYAKNLAGVSTNWIVTGEHSSLLIYIIALLFRLGFSEAPIKFLVEIIPSIILIYLTYKIVLLIYNNKKLALVSSFLMAVFWNILFNSMRFHVGVPALLLAFLAIYVFFQGYERKQKIFGKINPNWAIPITLILVVLTYSIRRGYFLFGFFFLFYMLATHPIKKLLKDKYNWIGLALSIVLFFFIEKTIFTQLIFDSAGTYYHPESAITGIDLQVFGLFFSNIFNPYANYLLYLFYFGSLLIVLNVFFSLGYIKKRRNNFKLKGDIFFLISLIVTMSYFIFYQRSPGIDPRWYYPILLSSFVCIARASLSIPIFVKKYTKNNLKKYSKAISTLAVIFVIFFLLSGAYFQVKQADQITKSKIPSFNGLRQASLFVKEISQPDDVIVCVSRPQPAYYAERLTIRPGEKDGKYDVEITLNNFLNYLKDPVNGKLKFMIVTFSQSHHPIWMQRIQGNQWQIPFMDTIIDFQTGQQKIEKTKSYSEYGITFNLLTIKDDAFVYEIQRE